MHESVPQEAVSVDSQLESGAMKASLELYQHRWHWTLDETNPDRVNFADYGLAVARSATTIRMQAMGYAEWLKNQDISLHDHVQRANMSSEKATAVAALSEAMHINFSTTRRDYTPIANQIRTQAKAKAEENGTSYEEEVAKLAEFHARSETARRADRARTREQHGLRFVGIENEITKARNSVQRALLESQGVDWTDQEREILGDSIRKLSALLTLVDMSITGTVEVDWDAELRKLGVA